MAIQIKIFLGYIQNKEFKIHLNQSKLWKESKLIGQANLEETSWHEKDYIGYFIPQLMSCNEIRKKEQEINIQLQVYCPKLNLEKYSPYLISQFFIL